MRNVHRVDNPTAELKPMMQRPAANQFSNIASGPPGWLPAVLKMLQASGLYEAAWQENRRRERMQKRWGKHSWWRNRPGGNNGKRECDRRMRQIACGQLRAENGLVVAHTEKVA